MFFKKINNKNKTEETLSAEVSEQMPEKHAPVYIIGDNALTCYLAAKISPVRKTIIISGTSENTSLSTNGITFKEERTLQKKHCTFQTSFMIREKPEAVIIAASPHKIKAATAAAASKNIGDAPILCFTPLKNFNLFTGLFNENIFRAFFDGYLSLENQLLSQLGRQPSVTLCMDEKNSCFPVIKELFSASDIAIHPETNETSAFWNYLTPYAAGSLLSAYFNKNLALITKDKSLRDNIKPLVKELCAIARSEIETINEDDILKKLYNTPNSYVYPLQAEFSLGKIGELDSLSSCFLDISQKKKLPDTEIRKILNKLYNIILA